MITRLSLKNFMKHAELDVTFGSGLQVIRGSNEAGKSSILQGIAYALFGSRALRASFSETVHRGQPESSLKVELTMESSGRVLTFTRSKAGAEVSEAGSVIVTGQTEVSGFASKILGADVQAASRLMMSNQGNLRGSLEQGPKGTAQMIESLADFDLFERLIEAAQSKLLLGNTDALEQKLGDLQASLEGMPPLAEPDLQEARSTLETLQGKVSSLETSSEALHSTWQTLRSSLQTTQARLNDFRNAEQHLKELQQTLTDAIKRQSDNLARSTTTVTDDMIEAKAADIQAASSHAAILDLWSKFSALSYPEVFWEGTEQEFKTEVARCKVDYHVLKSDEDRAYNGIVHAKNGIVTQDTCHVCGSSLKDRSDIAEKNKALSDEVERLNAELAVCAEKVKKQTELIHTYEEVESSALSFKILRQVGGDRISADLNFYPPKLSWVGPTPAQAPPDINKLRAELKALQEDVAAAKIYANVAREAGAQVELLTSRVKAAEERLESFGSISEDDVNKAAAAEERASRDWQYVYTNLSHTRTHIGNLEVLIKQALDEYDQRKSHIEKLKEEILERKQTLDKIRFNNGLLKKIRSARPIIADKLWNTVLASVSTMFSRMRGVTSIVEKTKEGFSVNGQPVEILSGSTLDILGLAIRTALIKTFLPSCPFIVLDEPGAAMDIDRVGAMLGFVHATGFNQVILVTHDTLAETVADNVIQL